MAVRTRFAPSPTGELHLGNLRTALYAFLYARHHRGQFYIRIEDTDRERYVPGSEQRLLETLKRIGVVWDEGPDIGGPYGPYTQSQRLDRYRRAAAQLVEQGSAYRCDCTPERLAALRDSQTQAKQPTRYDGNCRARTDVDSQKPHVIRFRVPEVLTPSSDGTIGNERYIEITDIIHGSMSVQLATLDDFVILKSDNFPTYHLAHIVDDHEMATTHVIRGDEWLPSLPKHVLLFRAFGWAPPAYAHLALLLNTQHKKLSKRDADVNVTSFLDWCLPDALRNFVALLGWNPSGDREIYSLEELIATFDLAKVNASPAVVDFTKLEWINGEYIRQRPGAEFIDDVRAAIPASADADPAFVLRVIALEQPRLKRLNAFPTWYFEPIHFDAPLNWKQTGTAETRDRLRALLAKLEMVDPWPDTSSELEAIVKPWIEEHRYGVGETLWPMRVALSGQRASPSPFELAWCFGKSDTLKRIAHAIEVLNS